LGYFREKPSIQLDMKYTLNTKGSGFDTDKSLKLVSAPEAEELEIEPNELVYLNKMMEAYLAKKNDHIRLSKEIEQLKKTEEFNQSISSWIELENHPLPRDLFELPEEKPGVLGTTYNVKNAFIPEELKHNHLEGKLISAVTVRRSNLKTLITPKTSDDIKTHIYIINCRGLTEDSEAFDRKSISSIIEVRLFTTFIHDSAGDKVMLDVVDRSRSYIRVDDRGLELSDLLMGIKLKDKDVFCRHYSRQEYNLPFCALSQVSNIEEMESIKQVLDEGKVKQLTLHNRFYTYYEIYTGDFQEQARLEHYGHPKQFIGTAMPEEMLEASLDTERFSLYGKVNQEGDSYAADVFLELSFTIKD